MNFWAIKEGDIVYHKDYPNKLFEVKDIVEYHQNGVHFDSKAYCSRIGGSTIILMDWARYFENRNYLKDYYESIRS